MTCYLSHTNKNRKLMLLAVDGGYYYYFECDAHWIPIKISASISFCVVILVWLYFCRKAIRTNNLLELATTYDATPSNQPTNRYESVKNEWWYMMALPLSLSLLPRWLCDWEKRRLSNQQLKTIYTTTYICKLKTTKDNANCYLLNLSAVQLYVCYVFLFSVSNTIVTIL